MVTARILAAERPMAWLHNISLKVSRLVQQMDLETCLFLVAGVLIVGLLCLRGFGSRSNY
jgi:hypothetical protein